MATGRSRQRPGGGAAALGDAELSAAKQAKLLREVMTDAAAFDAWVLRHPRGFAAALGLCGPPQRFFEALAQAIKKGRESRMAAKRSKKEEKMATRKVKEQFSGVGQLGGNIPWEGLVDLLREVTQARRSNEILLPLVSEILELQSLTARAHKPAFRPELRPTLDKAMKLARAALTDLSTHDLDTAKRRLRQLEAAVQDVRDSLDA